MKLYTTGCPKCRTLEQMLKRKGVEYTECNDIEEMKKLGLTSVPYLDVDGKLLDYNEALRYVRGL